MFSFLRKKAKPSENSSEEQLLTEQQSAAHDAENTADTQASNVSETPGFFGRLKQGLSRSSTKLTEGFADLVLGRKTIDDDLLEELETQLLSADLGIEATQTIINDLTQRVARKQLNDPEALFAAMHADMVDILKPVSRPLQIPSSASPFVILMVGINGVGKTTTIGKLAKQFQLQGKKVMLAAGDTFRAAAVADTAGRLHTQSNLMEELKKVKRVMAKLDGNAPHEVMLVLDAGTGQNALSQAEQFHQAVGLTGITLTKLDGTAKGGIIFAIAKKIGLPIRYIGVGEKIDDLRTFEAEDFVDALLGRETQ